MIDFYLKGGMLIYPILVVLAVSIFIVLERGWFFWCIRGNPHPVFKEVKERFLSRDHLEAWRAAARVPGPVGVVLKEGLIHLDKGLETVQEIMAEQGEEAIQSARKGLRALAHTASIAVALGVIGTIIGLVEVFSKVAAMEGRVSLAIFSSGVLAALVTTLAGVSVALPTMVAYNYYEQRIAHLAFQVKHYGREMLLLFHGTHAAGRELKNRFF